MTSANGTTLWQNCCTIWTTTSICPMMHGVNSAIEGLDEEDFRSLELSLLYACF